MKKFNILTIDGGGIRGLMSLYILRELERMEGKPSHEIFDLIAGTSTGGIIAGMLTLGYDADDLIKLYEEHGEGIFKKKWYRWGIFRPKYSDKYLNKVIESFVADTRLEDCSTRLMIPTYNLKTRDKVIFKSFKDMNASMFDIIRATSSAQSYFRPHKIDGESYIDGGMVINNPALASYVEYVKRWDEKELNMLSLGTGRNEEEIEYAKNGGGMLAWAKPTVDVLLTEQTQQVDYYMSKLEPDNYLRLEPEIKYSNGKMDDASEKNMANMKKDGEVAAQKNLYLVKAFLDKTS